MHRCILDACMYVRIYGHSVLMNRFKSLFPMTMRLILNALSFPPPRSSQVFSLLDLIPYFSSFICSTNINVPIYV